MNDRGELLVESVHAAPQKFDVSDNGVELRANVLTRRYLPPCASAAQGSSRTNYVRILRAYGQGVPRLRRADPLAKKVGARIRALREEHGLTLEKLAYESDVGSKGFLSDIEKGLARPTLTTLAALADRLEVALLDIVTFPEEDERQQLVDRSRFASPEAVRRWLRDAQTPPTRRSTRSQKRE